MKIDAYTVIDPIIYTVAVVFTQAMILILVAIIYRLTHKPKVKKQ